MTTAYRKGRVIVAAAIIALFAVPVGVAGPASAAPPSEPVAKYVAVGDSVAAGQGTGVYVDTCLRSPLGYPALLDAEPRTNLLRNAACTGADFADVAVQLDQVNKGTTLITLTAGANGVNLPGLFAACSSTPPGGDPSPQCIAALGLAGAYIEQQLPLELGAALSEIGDRSPRARTVVTGYALPFAPLPSPVFTAVNGLTAALNAALAGTVAVAQAQGANVVFADVAPAFAGHGAFGGDPWVGEDPANLETFLHPNAEGYQAYAAVVGAVR